MTQVLTHGIRTDLALEAAEYFRKNEHSLEGVSIEEKYDEKNHILVTTVNVQSENGAKKIGKPMGTYITVETPFLSEPDESYHQEITDALVSALGCLMPDIKDKKLLVVGIGNREITPDALGPLVVEHLFITRHLIKVYGKDGEVTKGLGNVSAIAPGVMAQTGMEGKEIIAGVIRETQPEVLVVVDALAARNTNRLNRTIQLTDTGIRPGAGVGNHRNELTGETLGIPVIAIGIPTVIDAATIVSDTIEHLFDVLDQQRVPGQEDIADQNVRLQNAHDAIASFDAQEKYLLMRELMEPMMSDMFVTPKDIDETIGRISFTISEAINRLCHQV